MQEKKEASFSFLFNNLLSSHRFSFCHCLKQNIQNICLIFVSFFLSLRSASDFVFSHSLCLSDSYCFIKLVLCCNLSFSASQDLYSTPLSSLTQDQLNPNPISAPQPILNPTLLSYPSSAPQPVLLNPTFLSYPRSAPQPILLNPNPRSAPQPVLLNPSPLLPKISSTVRRPKACLTGSSCSRPLSRRNLRLTRAPPTTHCMLRASVNNQVNPCKQELHWLTFHC